MALVAGAAIAESEVKPWPIRAYIVGEDGHFLNREARTWRDDRQAVKWAKQLVDGRVIELWCGERFVVKFEPKPDNGGETTDIG
jgi:hypothetical protein